MIDEEVQPSASAGREHSGTPPEPATPAAPVERWLVEHGDVLWRYALARTRSPEIAEDVIQETILAAIQGHSSFKGASTERTWLLGIASNKVANLFRELQRRSVAREQAAPVEPPADSPELTQLFTAGGMWARPLGNLDLGPGTRAENAELLTALRRCIDALPPSLAEAVWLRDVLNIPVKEVCEGTSLTPTNLWSRAHRARSALRLCMETSMGIRKEDVR